MLKTVPCVVLTSLKASTYSEYASAFRSLRPSNELVLSILQAVESTCQRRSHLESILNVTGGATTAGAFIGCGLAGRSF
jgi:hypothetical protein